MIVANVGNKGIIGDSTKCAWTLRTSFEKAAWVIEVAVEGTHVRAVPSSPALKNILAQILAKNTSSRPLGGGSSHAQVSLLTTESTGHGHGISCGPCSVSR